MARIEEIDQQLTDWVTTATGASSVTPSAPLPVQGDGEVSVYLLDMLGEPTARGSQKPPLQVALRYLVTAGGADARAGHRYLWDLVVKTLEKAEPEQNGWAVEMAGMSAATWLAMGVTPRPSIVLRVPLRHEWATPVAPPVTRPMEVRGGFIQELAGRIVAGPDDLPVAGALVELTALGRSTYTDGAGRFRFGGVPAGALAPDRLRVRAKGRDRTVALGPAAGEATGGELLVRFPLNEG